MSKSNINGYAQRLVQLEKRLKLLHVIPNMVPTEALKALANGQAVMLVIKTKKRYFLGIYKKPHGLERMFE